MHILITGGLGHIGSLLVRSHMLHAATTKVGVIDNLSSARYCSLFDLSSIEPIYFFQTDAMRLLPRDLAGVQAVIHLAAQTDATASVERRDEVFANNLGATKRVVELAHEVGARLIFASTTSVYGSQESQVDETCDSLQPQSPYAECKLREESLIREAVTDGLDGAILRLGTIAGPSPGMRFHTAVNKFCLQASLGEPLSVWETAWLQRRPYLDIEDAVNALIWAACAEIPGDKVPDPIFNVVTENLSVQDIVRAVEGAFGDVTIEFTQSPIMNQLSYEVSTDRAAAAGFKPAGSIADAIMRTAKLLQGVRPYGSRAIPSRYSP